MKTSMPRVLTTLAFLCLAAVGQKALAVVPAPDGCYPGYTTAEGCKAVNSLTSGLGNTGLGWYSLFSNTTANFNTGVGGGTLTLNNGDSNTAVGAAALLLNTTGFQNTATGADALLYNDDGYANTANGVSALLSNAHGAANSAFGAFALYFNSDGDNNCAFGYGALQSNDAGFDNTAVGVGALDANVDGSFNTAAGAGALAKNTGGVQNNAVGGLALGSCNGSENTAVGHSAGGNLTTGDGNVYVGAGVQGVADEANHTYVRNINTTPVSGGGTDTVTVNLSTGLLGHLSSSQRYKENVKPMENTSETLYQLKPVTYRYKKEIDSTQSPAFGLIAEEVAKANPDLVARNAEGQPESVHYEMVNAMLLNEFLKEHKAFLEERSKVQNLEAALRAVNQRLNEQEAKIERVRAQNEVSTATPKTASN